VRFEFRIAGETPFARSPLSLCDNARQTSTIVVDLKPCIIKARQTATEISYDRGRKLLTMKQADGRALMVRMPVSADSPLFPLNEISWDGANGERVQLLNFYVGANPILNILSLEATDFTKASQVAAPGDWGSIGERLNAASPLARFWLLSPSEHFRLRGRADTDAIWSTQSAASMPTYGDLGSTVGLRRARVGDEGKIGDASCDGSGLLRAGCKRATRRRLHIPPWGLSPATMSSFWM
jgi:hypothetical protein